MDDRMVKCSDFLWDLGLAAALLGLAQAGAALALVALGLLRRFGGEGGRGRKKFFGYVHWSIISSSFKHLTVSVLSTCNFKPRYGEFQGSEFL